MERAGLSTYTASFAHGRTGQTMEQPENLPKPACAWRTPVLMLCPGMAAVRHPPCRERPLLRAALRGVAGPLVHKEPKVQMGKHHRFGQGFAGSRPVHPRGCPFAQAAVRFIRAAVRSPNRLPGSSARLFVCPSGYPVHLRGCPFAQTAARLPKRAAPSVLRCYGCDFPPASVPAQNPYPLRSCSAPPGRRDARSQRTRSADGAPRRIRTGPCCRQARSHRPR